MASSKFSVECALQALSYPGFYAENDPEVGERAAEPFEDINNEPGFEFYERNFLRDKRISGVLEASFGQSQLVDYRTFEPDPTRIFQFRSGGEEAGCILAVLLWPPGSEVIYYSNSLKYNLVVAHSDNGLWRVPQAAVNKFGLEGISIPFPKGGLTIQDGRTWFTFLSGKPIAATFASNNFLATWRWKRRKLSTTEETERKLKASENEKFGLYFEF